MAMSLMVITVIAMFCVPSTSKCATSKTCTIRSKLRNSLGHHSLLKVTANAKGIPTSVLDFTGEVTNRIGTEFRLETCTRKSGNTFELIVTVHWIHDLSYAVAVKSGGLVMEKASGADITDRHRFVVRANGQSCGQNAQCATYKSVEVSKYIAMHMSSGDIFMTYSQANRGTALLVDCP